MENKMRKLHEKSIVLGIGIGMIITSIAGMIYSAGTQKELGKEEIISLAKTYGLIEPAGFLNKNNVSDNTKTTPEKATPGNTQTANNTASNTTTDAKEIAETTTNKQQEAENLDAERNISIAVQSGFGSKEVAKALLEKGVITSVAQFNTVLDSYNASQKIRTGTYLFKKNDDLNYIVKTICKFK
jgi:hypothetical protein